MPGEPTLLSRLCYRLLSLIWRSREWCSSAICIKHRVVFLPFLSGDTPLVGEGYALERHPPERVFLLWCKHSFPIESSAVFLAATCVRMRTIRGTRAE